MATAREYIESAEGYLTDACETEYEESTRYCLAVATVKAILAVAAAIDAGGDAKC